MLLEMKVTGLAIDPLTDTPVVILKDESGKQTLPIWIGLTEASAIASELEGVKFDRPLTHDLMYRLLGQLGGRLDRIEITHLRDRTFYAVIHYVDGSGIPRQLDARPSDALALALRAGAPIRVAKKIVDRARRIELPLADDEPTRVGGSPASEHSDEPPLGSAAYLELLQSLPDKQFGKWKM